MGIFILVALALIVLVVLERKDIIDGGEFAIAVVLILSAVAGYMGVSHY
ncbi:hypothetical protein [Providencia alcalifaciens]|nr:hypothetical protein [Providencia alcalifaciens]ETT00022.1 hypothetical protein HMPREF1568_0490 [Providencia alcalifaciens PAL-3]EUD01171.1 hypothetical protein HMPREF1566_3079 [Providencia alcalifaciens PAL-1]